MGQVDLVCGLVLLGLSVFISFGAARLPLGVPLSPGPGFYPLILGVSLGVTSFLLVARAAWGKGHVKHGFCPPPWSRRGKLPWTMGALLTYALLLDYAGYLVATFLFFLLVLRLVESKEWGLAGAVAFCAALLSYLLFSVLLGIPFPAGMEIG